MFSPTSWKARRTRSLNRLNPPRNPWLNLLRLEDRVVPSTVTWIAPGSGYWDAASNWSGGAVPGAGDDAVINTTAAVTITIQEPDNITVGSVTTASTDSLTMSRGSLTVTSGTSVLNGPLTLTDGTLTASGNATGLAANGTTSLSAANLVAESGGSISLPTLTSYGGADGTFNGLHYFATEFEATGAGSTLSLPNLSKSSLVGAVWIVDASQGGQVRLPQLSTISMPPTYQNGAKITADGIGSDVDISSLTNFSGTDGGSAITVTNGGTILDPNLTSLNDVAVNIDGTGTIAINQWTSIADASTITATSGSYSFVGLTDFDGSNVTAEAGASISMPNLSRYTGSNTTFESTGTGSILTLPNLNTTTLPDWDTTWNVEALQGGQVRLPQLTTISIANELYIGAKFTADGSGSQINISSLANLSGSSATSAITDTDGGTILAPELVNLTNVVVTLDGADAHVADNWTSLTSGSLTVEDGGIYTLPNLTDVDQSSLYAENGGQLSLPSLTKSAVSGVFQAEGAGSVLNLSALGSVTQPNVWTVNALDGGTVNLSGITNNSGANNVEVTDTSGGRLVLPNLTNLYGISVTLDGTDAHVADNWTSYNSGTLVIENSGTYTLPSLTNINGASLFAENGGQLILPNVTIIVAGGMFQSKGIDPTTNQHSLLDLSALTTETQTYYWTIDASSGGVINLSALTSTSTVSNYTVSVDDTVGGTIIDPNLTKLKGVNVLLDGTDAHVADSWTLFSDSTLTVQDGGAYFLPALTDVDQSSLFAEDGGQLTLPGLTTTAVNGTFESVGIDTATGQHSLLDLSALSALTEPGSWLIRASAGGTIDLSAVSDISSVNGVQIIDTNGGTLIAPELTSLQGVIAVLDGTDAHVADLWTTFTKGALIIDNGAYTLPSLTNVNQSSLETGYGGHLTLPNVTAAIVGGVAYYSSYGQNSVLDLPLLNNLSMVDGLTISADSNGTVNLPAVASLSATDPSVGGLTINANSGGTVNLAAITSLSGVYQDVSIVDVGSGVVADPNLAGLDNVQVMVDGTDPSVSNAWKTFTNGSLSVTSGSVAIPNLTDFSNSTLHLDVGVATVDLPDLPTGTVDIADGSTLEVGGSVIQVPVEGISGATINVPASQGLTINLEYNGSLTGTTINVGQDTDLVLSGNAFAGGVTLNVASGATLDISRVKTIGGTITGSGTGNVLMASGTVGIATGGATLDFPGAVFLWTGGTLDTSAGNVSNLGTVNLAGEAEKTISGGGVLDNFGTIMQNDSGNLGLVTSGSSPTTFINESGANYLIEGQSGINHPDPSGGRTGLINRGTIRTVGEANATIDVNGTIDNTGTIEADTGGVDLVANNIVQISGGVLTGGTWNALNGGILQFPYPTAITNNAGTIALSGSDSQIAGIIGLASNSGVFTVGAGASFDAMYGFTNNGTLTIETGGTVAVGGVFTNNGTLTLGGSLSANFFTQTKAATYFEQIGGSAESGLFGHASTVVATLSGTLNVSLVNGYVPAAFQSYAAITYSSLSGGFSNINGGPYFKPLTTYQGVTLVDAVVNPVRSIIAVGSDAGYAAKVNVYDAGTGRLKFSINPYSSAFRGGVRVATGDVNGDGVADVITAPGPGMQATVKVFDGSTGQLIETLSPFAATFLGGAFVAAGDVNGDGLADIIVGLGPGAGPRVVVSLDATGVTDYNFLAFVQSFRGGVHVAAGDVNGDGHADIIVGSGPGAGRVAVFDGGTGRMIKSFVPYPAVAGAGVFVAGADVNGDGRGDIVTAPGPGGGTTVRAYDGGAGGVLRSFTPFVGIVAGGVRLAAGDVNGDGRGDLILAGPNRKVYVDSGTNLAALDAFTANDPTFLGGMFVG